MDVFFYPISERLVFLHLVRKGFKFELFSLPRWVATAKSNHMGAEITLRTWFDPLATTVQFS